MTEQDQLKEPLDEIEIARLHDACKDVLTPAGMMLLRRVLFQLDQLKMERKVRIDEGC